MKDKMLELYEENKTLTIVIGVCVGVLAAIALFAVKVMADCSISEFTDV